MSSALQSLSDGLAAAVEAAGRSVVQVDARRRRPASGIVWSAEGLIVTASHVVETEDDIGIGLPDGRKVSASLVGRDLATDVALLRAAADGLQPATWIEADALRVGQLVLAVARPGPDVQATLGVVSVVGPAWRTGAGGLVDRMLVTDVVMYPGFSGGALVDVAGRVVGMNSSALMRGASPALPVATLRRAVEALLAHGRVKRGYLGVSTQRVRLPAALQSQLGQETGLLVVTVLPDSPAERHGLFLGDTIVAVAGESVRRHDDLLAKLSGDRVGQAVPIRVVRGGQVLEVNVVVGEREEP
ncbi:MAG: S1C family serine protease [Caldilineales bacterium]|nr:S1C family serine protease [Caldilineales bacterium]MDW8319015.1 trypsin-like peptidase domain-containing protein [Anaerolineae bacterium]